MSLTSFKEELNKKTTVTPTITPSPSSGASSLSAFKSQLGKPTTVAPIAQPIQPKGDNFLVEMLKGMVNPIAKTGVTLYGGALRGMQMLGNKEAGTAAENIISQGMPLGPLGNVKPIGAEAYSELQKGDIGKGEFLRKATTDLMGTGIETAANFIPVGKGAGLTYDVLKGATKYSGRQAFKEAAIPLVKQGVLSGGGGNLGRGLQEDQGVSDLIGSTIGGAITGGVTAPLFGAGGAVTGKTLGKFTRAGDLFEGKIKVPVQTQKEIEEVANYTRGPLDKFDKAILRGKKTESGYPEGPVKSIFGKKQYALGEHDIARANAVKDLVKPNQDTNVNIGRVLQNIDETYNNELIPFLQENPVPYNYSEMNDYLNNKMKPSSMLKPGGDSYYAFNSIKKKGLDILNSFPNTTEGVQKARSAIDNMIREEFGPALLDNTQTMHIGAKEASLKLRTALNDFTHDSIRVQDMTAFNKAEDFLREVQKRGIKLENIQDVKDQLTQHFGATILPENELKALLFRNKLKNLNYKLEAVDNMWDNAAKEIGKSRIENMGSAAKKLANIGVGLGVGTVGTLGLSRLFRGAPNPAGE